MVRWRIHVWSEPERREWMGVQRQGRFVVQSYHFDAVVNAFQLMREAVHQESRRIGT